MNINIKRKNQKIFWAVMMILTLLLCSMPMPASAASTSNTAATGKSVTLRLGGKTVTEKTYQMNVNAKKKLTVQTTATKNQTKTVTYTSSNRKIAKVTKNGTITAVGKGTAKVTVKVILKNKTTGKKITRTSWVKIKVLSVKDNAGDKTSPASGDAKVLVVYFSCTDNTKRIAELIQKNTDADIYRIEAETPYTSADLNYSNSNSRASKEESDDTARPAISGTLPDLSSYDTVYIGYPIWWGQAPKILYTFTESVDLQGKTVIPFCTSASSGIGSSASNLKSKTNADGNWLSGKRFSGSAAESDITAWIKTFS